MRFALFLALAIVAEATISGCGGNGSSGPVVNQANVYGVPQEGFVDGPVAKAEFGNPAKVEVGPDGSVYVADYDNNAIRVISPNGIVGTVVKQANFVQPFGLTFSKDGFLYVSTDWNDQGRKDDTSGTLWQVDVKNKTATVVQRNLGRPRGLRAISSTQIAMADLFHDTISIIDTTTKVVTVIAGAADQTGHVNASGSAARFNGPYGMTQLPDGSLLVVDCNNNCIRRVTLAGEVSDYAGSTSAGLKNGPAATATFLNPEDVAYSNGNAYVADTGNHVIRRIGSGTVSTEAGNGKAGFVVAPGTSAEFYGLEGIAILPGSRTLWIADGNEGDGSNHNHVRKITVP
jgi:glucose/arabinose dehydrogenase